MSALANVHGYPAPVWARFLAPDCGGRLSGGDVVQVEAGSPAAHALLRLSVKLADGRVRQARFQAYGCPVAIAVGQWLAERLQQSRPFVPPTAAEIRAALEIPEDKAHCALLGEDVALALLPHLKSSP